MEVGFKSDKGLKRSNNEDACFVLLPDKVYLVADGVGGGNAGEIASRTAVSEIAGYIVEHPIKQVTNKYAVVNYFQDCLDNANAVIFDKARRYKEWQLLQQWYMRKRERCTLPMWETAEYTFTETGNCCS